MKIRRGLQRCEINRRVFAAVGKPCNECEIDFSKLRKERCARSWSECVRMTQHMRLAMVRECLSDA